MRIGNELNAGLFLTSLRTLDRRSAVTFTYSLRLRVMNPSVLLAKVRWMLYFALHSHSLGSYFGLYRYRKYISENFLLVVMIVILKKYQMLQCHLLSPEQLSFFEELLFGGILKVLLYWCWNFLVEVEYLWNYFFRCFFALCFMMLCTSFFNNFLRLNIYMSDVKVKFITSIPPRFSCKTLPLIVISFSAFWDIFAMEVNFCLYPDLKPQ